MWENIKLVWRDRKARWGLILVIVILLGTLLPLFFALEADAFSISGFHYRFRIQNGYGGIFYPLNVSDGFDCVTGNFYAFQNINLFDGNGDPVTVSTAYRTYTFDLSSLDLSYDYEILIVSNNGAKISNDGFLTTLHTLGSSDPVFTTTRILYSPCNFYPDRVSFTASGNTGNINMRSYTTGLNSLLVNSVLTLSLDSNSIGFVISVAGTDFQQLLYRAGVIDDSSQYFQLLDDVSSALASGDISPDQAAIINDTASNTQSEQAINNITEAHSNFNSIIQQFISSSTNLHGEDLLENYKLYNDRLTQVLNSYIASISDPSEALAISNLYQVAVQDLESEYSDLSSFNFFTDLDSLDNTSDSYFDQEQEILDYVASVNIENLINVHSWINKLSNQEVSEIKSLFENFFSGYFWSVWIEIPIALSVVSALIGSSYFLVARSSRRRRGK